MSDDKKSAFLEMIEQQLAAANSGMQMIVKANMSVFEGYQTQIGKIMTQATETFASNQPDLIETIKAQSASILNEVKRQTENLKNEI